MSYPLIPNNTHLFDWTVGPSRNSQTVYRTFNFPYTLPDQPRYVLCQTRNATNQPTDWPDQFSVQVIRVTRTSLRVAISRVDNGRRLSLTIPGVGTITYSQPPTGWGQDLRLVAFVDTL